MRMKNAIELAERRPAQTESAVTTCGKQGAFRFFAAKNVPGWLRACCIYFASPHILPMANDMVTVLEPCNLSGSSTVSPFGRSCGLQLCSALVASLAGSDFDTEILVLSIETQ